jgi:hypothetical protein
MRMQLCFQVPDSAFFWEGGWASLRFFQGAERVSHHLRIPTIAGMAFGELVAVLGVWNSCVCSCASRCRIRPFLGGGLGVAPVLSGC